MTKAKRKFQRVIPDQVNVIGIQSGDIEKLEISCGSTKCNDGLHCFTRYMKRAEKKYGKKGVCHNCGHDSIDWERIHKNDISDAAYIFESLNKELLRKVFDEIKVDKNALESAKGKPIAELKSHAKKKLKQRIGKYNNRYDGQQTPLGKDDITNYAQHATGTCCRQCLHAWHNIPMEGELSDNQLEFCTELAMLYITDKLNRNQ